MAVARKLKFGYFLRLFGCSNYDSAKYLITQLVSDLVDHLALAMPPALYYLLPLSLSPRQVKVTVSYFLERHTLVPTYRVHYLR